MASVASDSSLDDLSIDDAWETELEIALLGSLANKCSIDIYTRLLLNEIVKQI